MYIEWKCQDWQKVWESILNKKEREIVFKYPKQADFLIRIKILNISVNIKNEQIIYDKEEEDIWESIKEDAYFSVRWKDEDYEIYRKYIWYSDRYDSDYTYEWFIRKKDKDYKSFEDFFLEHSKIQDYLEDLYSVHQQPFNNSIQQWELYQEKKEKHRLFEKKKKKKKKVIQKSYKPIK